MLSNGCVVPGLLRRKHEDLWPGLLQLPHRSVNELRTCQVRERAGRHDISWTQERLHNSSQRAQAALATTCLLNACPLPARPCSFSTVFLREEAPVQCRPMVVFCPVDSAPLVAASMLRTGFLLSRPGRDRKVRETRTCLRALLLVAAGTLAEQPLNYARSMCKLHPPRHVH